MKVCTNKNCKLAGILQEENCFYKRKNSVDGFQYWCKTCDRKQKIAYRKNNKDKIKGHKLKSLYGISIADKQKMYENQKGKCAICNKNMPLVGNDCNIDHNHKTGQIRGLLCRSCNNHLAYIEDEMFFLCAMEYLKKYNF